MTTIAVSSEDRSAAAFTIAKRLLLLADGATRPDRLRLVPILGDAKAAAEGNKWKDKTSRFRKVMVNELATRLNTQRFVILHVDGDAAWVDPEVAPDWHHAAHVAELLEDVRHRLGEADPSPSVARCLLVVPHYSIESWLYHNRAEVAKLAPDALGWLDERVNAAGSFDAILAIKDVSPLGDAHNEALAASWTNAVAERACAASPSLAACVAALRANPQLRAALAATADPR